MYRVIASLEALATLLALRYLSSNSEATLDREEVQVTTIRTDNRGNGSALSKLASVRYPLNAIVMELSLELKLEGTQADVHWIPREFNVEADGLANGCHETFAESNRIHIDFAAIKWHILDRAIEWGAEFAR